MHHKVKLVAVAKDESAYLADWIQHHLFFGFAEIHVYINRTSDDSAKVLNSISQLHENVTFSLADWIDQLPPPSKKNLQHICYMQALSSIEPDITHLLFLDVDEYWVSQRYTCINDFLISGDKGQDLIVFEWLNEGAVTTPFLALPQRLTGKVHALGKSIINVSAIKNIKQIRLHVPIMNELSNVTLVDGEAFKCQPNLPQHVAVNINSFKHTFIFHRMFRSEMEYLAALYRGNPEGDFPIKLNRNGYGYINNENLQSYSFEQQLYAEYIENKKQFLKECNIDKYILDAQNTVEKKAEQLKLMLPNLLAKKPQAVVKVLGNLKDEKINKILRGYYKQSQVSKATHAAKPRGLKNRILKCIKF